MERASRVLAKLKLAHGDVSPEQIATAAWAVAVGSTIARHTSVVGLVRTRLVVEVEDAIWQRQLWALRNQILRSLDKALGQPPVVTDLEFRIAGPQRKPVQVSATRQQQSNVPQHEQDEADAIRDPMFRMIYRAARKKATA